MNLIAAAFLTVSIAVPAQGADWWWVAGDSADLAAVFVDGASVRRVGDTANVNAVRITRSGEASSASWQGRCSDRHADEEIAAVARFACGTDADHVHEAAMLPGLTPREAARAIFSVDVSSERRPSLQSD